MVSYPIDFPNDISVNQLSLTPLNAISRSASKFTYVEKVYNFQGQAWRVSGSLPLMARATAEEYMSFVFKLKGRFGTFNFPLPSSISESRGSWGGTVLVDGGSQTGDTLNIKGLTPSTTNIIRKGDYFNLGSGSSLRLYKVLDDVSSDGSGNATLTIWPNLRSSPNDNDPLVNENVEVLLRLEDNVTTDIDVNKHYLISFSAMEALDGS